jgi:hypothetical protein
MYVYHLVSTYLVATKCPYLLTYISTKLSFHLPTNIWYFIFSSVGLVVLLYTVYAAYSTINTGCSKKRTRLVWLEAIPATLSHTSTSSEGTWSNTNLVVLVLSKEHQYKVSYISLTSHQPKISLKPPTAPCTGCYVGAQTELIRGYLTFCQYIPPRPKRLEGMFTAMNLFLWSKERTIVRVFEWMVHWWRVLLCHINPKSSEQQGIFVY